MWLPISHLLRKNEEQFRGVAEHRVAPQRLTGGETKRSGEEREQWLLNREVPGAADDLVRVHGVKRKSALFTLPYSEVSSHTIPLDQFDWCLTM